MGNIYRLLIVIFNIGIFYFVKIDDIDIEVSHFLIFNILVFVIVLMFDSEFNKKNTTLLKDNDITIEQLLKKKVLYNIKRFSVNIFNWITLLFPITLFFFHKEHSFSSFDLFYSIVIYFHLLLNIIVLSCLINNFFHSFRLPIIIIIGVILQISNATFELSKIFLFWFSVFLIITSYLLIVALSYSLIKKKNTINKTILFQNNDK